MVTTRPPANTSTKAVRVAGIFIAVLLAVRTLVLSPTNAHALADANAASPFAVADIPFVARAAYQRAAQRCTGLTWELLAAIGKLESDHGRTAGASLDSDGRATPEIIGPPLDGTTEGTQQVFDTDNGDIDHDHDYDHAVGPMQFLPETWRAVTIDGNDDGVADINNIYDAAAAAAHFLCPDGTLGDAHDAALRYNSSEPYVTDVLDWARRYAVAATQPGVTIDGNDDGVADIIAEPVKSPLYVAPTGKPPIATTTIIAAAKRATPAALHQFAASSHTTIGHTWIWSPVDRLALPSRANAPAATRLGCNDPATNARAGVG